MNIYTPINTSILKYTTTLASQLIACEMTLQTQKMIIIIKKDVVFTFRTRAVTISLLVV